MSAATSTQWRDMARRYIAAGREKRRNIWREVDDLAPHLAESDRTGTFYTLVAALQQGDDDAAAVAASRLTGTEASS